MKVTVPTQKDLKIYQMNKKEGPWECMATTLTTSLFYEDHLSIGHVGDCRVYQVRDGRILCLTKDHSVDRHTLTRAIGTSFDIEVDVYEWQIKPNDCYIQCSDGLYSMVSEKDILNSAAESSVEKACEQLVKLANENGGADNITLQVIRLTGF